MDKNNSKEFSKYYIVESILCWLVTAAWMLLIYRFSDEAGNASSDRSSEVLEYLRLLFGKDFLSEVVLRKLFHILEFAVLALFSFLAIRSTNKISVQTSYANNPVKIIKSDNELYIVFSLWFCTFYAIIDEYHQLFVTDRSGSFVDVLIDLIGILFTLIIIRIIFTIYLKRLGKLEERYE